MKQSQTWPCGPCKRPHGGWEKLRYHRARRGVSTAYPSQTVRRARCWPASRFRFFLKQRALALDAPAVAGERSIVAHDAMARNNHRKGVRAAGLSHGTHGLGLADLPGNVRITRRGPG